MGAPAGHPYAHPEGVCINGLGALPSPYGPTLRGAHNGPSGLQKIKVNMRESAGEHVGTSTERNLGQNLCNLGQYMRLNVGSHLHMHMCPSPRSESGQNYVKISILAKIKLPTHQPKELNCTIMLVFVLVLVLLLMLKSNLIYFTERGIWLTF